jgi:uncharacterized protein (DUF488 family)
MAMVYTVGHSTRGLEDFLALLGEYRIEELVDVRRFPTSRRHPHFAGEALARALGAAGIAYAHEPDLGGYRKPRPDSPNTAWRVAGFRGYADYMDTPAFRTALDRVIERASVRATAVMCAEITPLRCHRRLIADALVARGLVVVHILGLGKTETHALNPDARVLADGRLVYLRPPDDQIGMFAGEEA